MQDNAPIHKAQVVQIFFRDNNINVFPWPAKSPDLNIIEHVWAKMSKAIYRPHYRAGTKEELKDHVMEHWEDIDLEFIRTLYDSIPSRLQAVIDNEGGNTRF